MIFRLLANRDYQIRVAPRVPAPEPALDALALLTSFHFDACGEFMHHMRGEMRAKPGFHVTLAGMSGERVVLLRNLCSLFRSNGLLAHYRLDPVNERIVGAVADTDRAFHFIGGDWLESAVRVNVSQFLNLDGTPVELLENVEIRRPDGRNFELDVVMAIDGALYWWEAKSGGYQPSDLDRYRAVARELGLPTNRAILVLAEPQPWDTRESIAADIGMTVLAPDRIAAFIEGIESRHRKPKA
jgi:hypothetical protein